MNLLNKSTGKAFEVIESFDKAKKDSLTITEISEITEMSISTAYRMASSLVSLGYLSKNPDEKTYSLGWKTIKLFTQIPNILQREIIRAGSVYAAELSGMFSENVSISINTQGKRMTLYMVEGPQYVRSANKPGATADITLGSPGKALLAFLPEEKWPRYFPPSDTDFADQLRAVREKGYATSDSEFRPGICSISAPIFGFSNEVIAVLTLSGPSYRFKSEPFDKKTEAVIRYANLISQAFAHRDNQTNSINT